MVYDPVYQFYSSSTKALDITYKAILDAGLFSGFNPQTGKVYTSHLASRGMRACASSDQAYYEADTPQEIAAQMQQILQHITATSARYTQ